MLLDAERACFLDGDGQLLKEFLKRRVRRQVQTIEACVSSVQVTTNHHHRCDNRSSILQFNCNKIISRPFYPVVQKADNMKW